MACPGVKAGSEVSETGCDNAGDRETEVSVGTITNQQFTFNNQVSEGTE